MQSLRRFSLILALVAAPALGQLGPGPYSAFPTSDVTDGRFLGFGCPGFATFESGVSITLSAGPSETNFTLSIFDGDTSGAVPTGHWDVGTRRLVYRLYFDPFRQSNTNPADLVGEWFGNTANPLTNPDPNPAKAWTASAATMPDNAWWGVQVITAPQAQSVPGANFFYHLRIEADGACVGSEQLESNIKIAASNPLNFAAPRFAFVAALRQVANDIPIIYPGAPPFPTPPPGGYVNFPTTFDGTFTFALNLPPGTTNFELFDGDWDFGTNPAQLVGSPSGTALTACLDTDDANTPASYSDFPPALSTTGANPEGAVTAGVPPDDNRLDLFRRGELGAPGRVGCVRYEVTDPVGNVYRNDNPSSNLEWERFRVVSANDPNAGNPAAYDYLVPTPFLAPGTWTVRLVALDMANLNFVYADLGVCSNITDTQSFGTLDFEQDAAGETLPDGTEISEQYASQGIHFSTNDPVNHPLVIFDSSLATIDPDLGTPNVDFGGPGIGAGGGLGQPGENATEQLNLLIIGDVETAQSFPGGGVVTLTFDAPREVTAVELIDITTVGGTVTAFDAMVGGSVIASAPITALGENSFQRVSLAGARNVRRLTITLTGEGGIAKIISGAGGTVPNCPPPVFAIGDTVWLDPDGNGVQGSGEPGISGVLMELLAVGNPTPIATAITGDATNPDFPTCRMLNTGLDEAGLYCFMVPPGNYTVRVAASNFFAGGPLASLASTTGGETQTHAVTKANVLTYDFGYRGTASLGDRVWLDSDGNGVQDGGEAGINGVTVELLEAANNVIATQVTAGDGNYTFAHLSAGTYTVRVVTATLPAGLSQTFDLDGLATPHQATATLAGGETRTDVDFGYRGTGSLGDRVWFDTNGNGVQEGGEAGINGVTVELLNAGNAVIGTQVTAGDGNYTFANLAAGTYSVRVVTATLPAGLSQTFDLDGLATPHIATAALAAGQNRTDVDFGYRHTGSLGDRVWFDTNGNGVQEGGEAGINGVTVELLNAGNAVIGTQVTAGDGNYAFANLAAGTYSVRVVTATLPAGLSQTFDLDGLATPHIATAALAAGQNRTDVDFGYRNLGSIGDRVWADPNGNGVQDVGESGINGVTVRLLDAGNNVLATQVTSGDGNYLFTGLAAGTYTVEVLAATLPGTFVQTFDLDGLATPHRATATLAAGQNRRDVDFGYCPVSSFASLGDRVWNDANGNGVQESGEAGINGVTVRLRDASNNLLASQVTSGNGNYSFGNLIAGTYTVEIDTATLPAGYLQTFDLDGLATPHRATATLAVSQNRTDVDFGYRQPTITGSLGDRVWYDDNGNGLQDSGEAGINGITVRLRNAAGTVIATRTTAGDGNYLFTGLAAGTYLVEVDSTTLPGGLVQTYDLDGLATPNKATATLAAGATRLDVDFGYAKCKGCSGGVERLTLLYLGATAGQVRVVAVSGATEVEVFNGSVAPGGLISLAGPGGSPFYGLLGDKVVITVDGEWNSEIDTSCKSKVGPGLIAGSFIVRAGVSKNGGPLCPVDSEQCAEPAANDPVYHPESSNWSLWLPGIATDLVFQPEPGGFTFSGDGTAHLAGRLVSLSNASHVLRIDANLSGFTTVPGAGSPKKELQPAAYKENGGPIDTNTWVYYTGLVGKLYGESGWAGADIDIVIAGPAFQIGFGANNKNLHYGASGWIGWDVWTQPSSGGSFPDKGQGDVNVDLGACPEPPCMLKGAASISFFDKQVRWNITNDGSDAAVVNRVEVTWPYQDGSLKTMRFGSTNTFWSGTDAASTADISGPWINPTSYRTISAGQTRTLRLYFQNTVRQWSDKYVIVVHFEDGCSVEYRPH